MRFFPAEPDISTLYNRIREGDIDLQPDFQRGEVWPVSKQQRLIDTILRGWVVPPVLLVRDSRPESDKQLVLDGQQRLAAIRDFRENLFSIDGRIKPFDATIESLHGLRYSTLPLDTRKNFDRTTIRIYEVADYKPEEPAEIFFRLNQPTVLTSAEKRNAFFGPIRDEIRDCVRNFEETTEASRWLGFSNSRMAYDDVFARFVATLDGGTLRKKITAAGVNEIYRRDDPLREEIALRFKHSVDVAASVFRRLREKARSGVEAPKLNKATFYSWLVFISRLSNKLDPMLVADFMQAFEAGRSPLASDKARKRESQQTDFIQWNSGVSCLVPIFTDRATARVSDVSSVLLRDFALWAAWSSSYGARVSTSTDPAYQRIGEFVRADESFHNEESALSFIEYAKWGEQL